MIQFVLRRKYKIWVRNFFIKILNEINCFELPPHKLDLKVEVHVMLLRNIDQSNGLYNGTRLQVRRTVKTCYSISNSYWKKSWWHCFHTTDEDAYDYDSLQPNATNKVPAKTISYVVSFAMTINKFQDYNTFFIFTIYSKTCVYPWRIFLQHM